MNQAEFVRPVARLSSATGITRMLAPVYGGIGAIFMLHRLTTDRTAELNQGLFTTTTFLDQYIYFLKSRRIEIVSLDEGVERIKHPKQTAQQFVCFTFDDGYKDNLSLGLPIFEKHRVPFTVYISPGLIERRFPYWGRVIEQIFKENHCLRFDYKGQQFSYLENWSYEQKQSNFIRFMNRVHFDREDIKIHIKTLMQQFNMNEQMLLDADALTVNELKQLAQSDLVTIGAHTINHPNLRSLDEQQAYHEMLDSKVYLESILHQPIRHFAYPFGDEMAISDREFTLAAQAGFLSSTTTKLGVLKVDHRYYLQALPRLPFNLKFESLAVMELLRSGIPAQIQRKTIVPILK